jgi:hypothetical protein
VTAPVLRHETGEALGQYKFRVSAYGEMARIYAPDTLPTEVQGISQKKEVFQAGLLGVQGAVGMLPKLDLQLGAYLSSGGGGWRLGAKYEILRGARFAVAGALAYGSRAGSGTVTYETAGPTLDLDQSLSAQMWELSVPVSFRLIPLVTAYGGLTFFRSAASGSFGTSVVSATFLDVGANLGMRFNVAGPFSADLEGAMLWISDPFIGSRRFIPYMGLGASVTF